MYYVNVCSSNLKNAIAMKIEVEYITYKIDKNID